MWAQLENMDPVEAFIANPTVAALESLTKDQLRKIVEHYGLNVSNMQHTKVARLGEIIIEKLCERQVLIVDEEDGEVEPNVSLTPHLLNPPSLSFKEQKELRELELKWEQEKTKARELELEKHEEVKKLELERLKLETEKMWVHQKLEEMKLDQEKERMHLILEGKLRDQSFDHNTHTNVSIVQMVKLLPKFNEKDPDDLFSLFESLAEDGGWEDSEKTLLLQSVLIGRAQQAYISLSSSERKSYCAVKDAVLKAYELVAEAYRQ